MPNLVQRTERLEQSFGIQRASYLVRTRDGETAAQAMARDGLQAPFVIVAPEVCQTSAEWANRHARTRI